MSEKVPNGDFLLLNEGFADAGWEIKCDERGKEKIGFLQLQITGQAIILLLVIIRDCDRTIKSDTN